MSTSGIILHTIYEEVVNPLTSWKYTVLNQTFVFNLHNFDLRDIFQECNPGVKLDLPALSLIMPLVSL
jgi:hypothetical protein